MRCLNGQRQGNGRLWRRLARAPEAMAGRSVGRSLPWERRASQSAGAEFGPCQGGHFDHAAVLHVLQPRAGSVHGTAVREWQRRESHAPLLKLLLRRVVRVRVRVRVGVGVGVGVGVRLSASASVSVRVSPNLRRGPNAHPDEDAAERLLAALCFRGADVLELEARVGVAWVHADGGDGTAWHGHGVVVGGVGEGRPRLLPLGTAAGRRELQDRWHLVRGCTR
eukprot:scaffold40272_cov68-Phaeocystis_antarctica.AAC.5